MQLSSNNKSIVVFSDPHQDTLKLTRILSAEQPDFAVCLGDLFDSRFYMEKSDAERTCIYLKSQLDNDGFVTLWGNHDLQYFWKNGYTYCTGYKQHTSILVNEYFGKVIPEVKKKFRWYVWIDDFLCSHAGLHPRWLPPEQSLEKDKLSKWLDEQVESAEIALDSQQRHWMFCAGAARSGRQAVGGINWLDWNREFEPIDGLTQIVGHTATRGGIRGHHTDGLMDLTQSNNLCIDCHLTEYLFITNGKLSIKKYADL